MGGDTLDIHVRVGPGAHGLITTPGATRFYKSAHERAVQAVHARLAEGARLEWLPLEALAYNQRPAENRAVFELAPGAELLGAGTSRPGPAGGRPAFCPGQQLRTTHRGTRCLAGGAQKPASCAERFPFRRPAAA